LTDLDVTLYKVLSGAADAIFIISWLISSALNKSSITEMDLDPEDDHEFDDNATDVGDEEV
jgi:hypothetical protein